MECYMHKETFITEDGAYELEPVKECQVELSPEDWDEWSDNDDCNKWQQLVEHASLSSRDSPDIIFYLSEENIKYLAGVEDLLTPKVLAIMKHALSCGYEYIKFYN